MHYIAERCRAGVQTLLIIDEFNALRMREETSILFEQVRSFGGNLVISAQGYSGLGPQEYAERRLEACSTYILHACSDPGPVSKRAGKKFFLDTSYSQDAEGNEHQHIRPRHDWRVPETSVMQQQAGQAYWIYRGRAQHVQTAQVPLTPLQVEEAWKDIKQQADLQEQLLAIEEKRRADQQAQRQAATASSAPNTKQPSPSTPGAQTAPAGTSKKRSSQSATKQAKPQPSAPPAAPRSPQFSRFHQWQHHQSHLRPIPMMTNQTDYSNAWHFSSACPYTPDPLHRQKDTQVGTEFGTYLRTTVPQYSYLPAAHLIHLLHRHIPGI